MAILSLLSALVISRSISRNGSLTTFCTNSDVTFDYRNGKNEMTVHQTNMEPWKVTVVDTGYNTMTGGRIKRIQKYVGNEPFLMTYGDGVVLMWRLTRLHRIPQEPW